uniref:Uncharacterized protein n=1 Tax=Ananas comosus var. bracteatus TaxID=296719 RepID=A0A6V7PXU7_ANACO|nr:unnamed protein product [Ananas comosus var. bracteatus]
MSIVWSYHPQYWRRIHHPESRFAEVAELLSVCWLHIGGTIDSQLLSHRTTYAAYLVFKLAPDSYGLNSTSQFASVKLGAYALRTLSLYSQTTMKTTAMMTTTGDDDDNDGELRMTTSRRTLVRMMRKHEEEGEDVSEGGWVLEVELGSSTMMKGTKGGGDQTV